MSPIEFVRHDYLGAYFGELICITCRHPVTGCTTLKQIHNGYEGNEGTELTKEQINVIYDCQKHHPQNHKTRIIFGHKSESDGNGYSKTEYEEDNRDSKCLKPCTSKQLAAEIYAQVKAVERAEVNTKEIMVTKKKATKRKERKQARKKKK